MGIQFTAALSVLLFAALTAARPSPEADAGYRSPPAGEEAPAASELREYNSLGADGEEEEAELSEARVQPYGALKLAVTEEPWGALKVAMAIAEQERIASERLHTERESVEVSATPEPDTEVVESSDEQAGGCRSPTTLVLKPYAKAVAGAGGTAIAAPESRAITRHASDIIIFEPRVIAVVGPGGHAVATSRLIIDTLPN